MATSLADIDRQLAELRRSREHAASAVAVAANPPASLHNVPEVMAVSELIANKFRVLLAALDNRIATLEAERSAFERT